MKITMQKAALLALALIGSSNAFVVELFDGQDCTGDSYEWNVWDNTCSKPPRGFQSFKPVVYRGNVQRADFFSAGDCAGDRTLPNVLEDEGKDPLFQLGQCQNAYNVLGGTNAMNSLSDAVSPSHQPGSPLQV